MCLHCIIWLDFDCLFFLSAASAIYFLGCAFFLILCRLLLLLKKVFSFFFLLPAIKPPNRIRRCMQLWPATFLNNNHIVCAQPSIWCCFIFLLWYSFLSASLSYIFNLLAQAQDAWCAGKTPLTGASAGQTASFVVLLIDREAPREALLESDSRLLLGTSQRVALPPLPTGVKGVHCTSVHQGDGAISRADGARAAPRGSDWRWHTNGWMTLKMSEALLGAATQQGWVSFFQRRIRRQWIDARGQRAVTHKADCLCFITQQDKSSVKHKTAGCFLQGRRFF